VTVQAHSVGCQVVLIGCDMLLQGFYDGFFDVSSWNAGD
jgi:hypothetical protein